MRGCNPHHSDPWKQIATTCRIDACVSAGTPLPHHRTSHRTQRACRDASLTLPSRRAGDEPSSSYVGTLRNNPLVRLLHPSSCPLHFDRLYQVQMHVASLFFYVSVLLIRGTKQAHGGAHALSILINPDHDGNFVHESVRQLLICTLFILTLPLSLLYRWRH